MASPEDATSIFGSRVVAEDERRAGSPALADIGGYTRFLKQGVFTLPHAQVIVDRLMGAVVRSASETLRFSAIEGDAVLLFAIPHTPQVLSAVTVSASRMFEAFVAEQHRMHGLSPCSCPACQSVLDLRIKFVINAGEILITPRRSRVDLAGPAVILAHRLLKNRVPVSEYLLSTKSLAAQVGDTAWSGEYPHREEVEGFGPVDLLYLEFDRIKVSESLVQGLHPRTGLFPKLSFCCALAMKSVEHALRPRTE